MLYDPKWSVPLTPQEALLRAADILERDGWCQRVRIDIEGRRCVAGAIDLATAHSPNPVARQPRIGRGRSPDSLEIRRESGERCRVGDLPHPCA
jgi:hypothetical protein